MHIAEYDLVIDVSSMRQVQQLEPYDTVVSQAEFEVLSLTPLEDLFYLIVSILEMDEPEVHLFSKEVFVLIHGRLSVEFASKHMTVLEDDDLELDTRMTWPLFSLNPCSPGPLDICLILFFDIDRFCNFKPSVLLSQSA